MPFTVQYAVPMTCGDCVSSITNALNELPDLEKVDVDLEKKLVTVRGEAAPSVIVQTLQSIGRDAIVRGSGRPNSAAVCILETAKGETRGLCRLIEDEERKIIVDCTAAPLDAGPLEVNVHATGDVSEGALSTGPALYNLGKLSGTVDGTSGLVARSSVSILDIIGRSIVVAPASGPTASSLAGVIARSAGVWENDKVVCSCSGMTLWDERKLVSSKGL